MRNEHMGESTKSHKILRLNTLVIYYWILLDFLPINRIIKDMRNRETDVCSVEIAEKKLTTIRNFVFIVVINYFKINPCSQPGLEMFLRITNLHRKLLLS
jgi:hypothetical protein